MAAEDEDAGYIQDSVPTLTLITDETVDLTVALMARVDAFVFEALHGRAWWHQ